MADTGVMIHIQSLIDDTKCFETVRTLRWPDGVSCPHCDSFDITKQGRADTPPERQRDIVRRAFDLGITHFDLANNYGPPPGSAEANFGRIMATDLEPYRDELIISTKAGYLMWPGPYGEWGSRKYVLASLDQSLQRMGLEYVDIFYSRRFDPNTPLEETLGALETAVSRGKALYVGISSYGPQKTREASALLRAMKVPFVIHQPSYSILNRWVEKELLAVLEAEGLSHRYGDRVGLAPLGFSLASPGVVAITGPNGSGKSTISDFIFYGLGGEYDSWKGAAKNCDEVQIEIKAKGATITVRRAIGSKTTVPFVFFGPMAEAEKQALDGWQYIFGARQRGHGRDQLRGYGAGISHLLLPGRWDDDRRRDHGRHRCHGRRAGAGRAGQPKRYGGVRHADQCEMDEQRF